MPDFSPANRQFFTTPATADHRHHPGPMRSVLPFRDRVALGYYDHPELTDAVVSRVLRMLNADRN